MKISIFFSTTLLILATWLVGCDNTSTIKDQTDVAHGINYVMSFHGPNNKKTGPHLIMVLRRLSNPALVYQEFRHLPPTTFIMGDDNTNSFLAKDAPRHHVKLTTDCWMATTECTQLLWTVVMRNNPSTLKEYRKQYEKEGLQHPVETVSWNDCQDFIKKLNKIAEENNLEYQFRLPTEAEWEYACQGGRINPKTKLPFRFSLPKKITINNKTRAPYIGECMIFIGNSSIKVNGKDGEKRHFKVKDRFPNNWGFYSMHGNVAEWCQDACTADPFKGVSTETYYDYAMDPVGISGADRIFRGGSWDSLQEECRASKRYAMRPDYKNSNLGLRLVIFKVEQSKKIENEKQ